MAANHTTATPSSKKSTQYILLSVFAILVILMYCLIFCTGGGKGTPRLGIDLQGGTRVTLTPSGNPSDDQLKHCLLYTSPSPRDLSTSRMPSSA